jgi:hypothetical protein
VAGTVASLVGTTCTIGDVAFTFESASSDSRWGGMSHPTGADEVFLTPDPSPLAPGFTWSGSFSLNSAPGEFDNILRFQLVLGVQALNSDTPIVAIGSAVGSVQSVPGSSGFTFVQAQNSNWPCMGACSIATATATEGDKSATVPTIPFLAHGFGLVQFLAEAQNGGNIAFDTVSFHFVLDPPCACDGPDCPNGVAPSGTVCRAASGECDAAESCDGTNFACPTANAVARAGTPCSGGTCNANGTCVPAPEVPTVSATGAIVMALLLASAILARLRPVTWVS